MVSWRNGLGGLGATAAASGFGYLSYTFYQTANDSAIERAARVCEGMRKTVQVAKPFAKIDSILGVNITQRVASAISTAGSYALPKAAHVAKDKFSAVCDTAIRLNNYSLHISIATGLVATGLLVFGLSRCFSVKVKED